MPQAAAEVCEPSSITIRLSADARQRLAERASRTGKNLTSFVEDLVERQAKLPPLDDILAHLRQDFAASGMSDDELGAFLTEVRDDARRDKRRTKPA